MDSVDLHFKSIIDMNLGDDFPGILSHQTGSSSLLDNDGKLANMSFSHFVILRRLYKGYMELYWLVKENLGQS